MEKSQASNEQLKSEVKGHWEAETCGTRYSSDEDRARYFRELANARYGLEPYIPELANFPSGRGKRVLEIGVGAGADFAQWCQYADHADGVDLTDRAIELTSERLAVAGIDQSKYSLQRMDGESLGFPDESFDIVYSYGVLHHSPDTRKAFSEVVRVLKPGGIFRGMIYHLHSWTTYMLYLQHGLLRGNLSQSPRDVVFNHLESPGTKVYTVPEARSLLLGAGFSDVQLWTQLGPGDMLTIQPSKKYQAPVFKLLWKAYPRWLVRGLGNRLGLGLMIVAQKPAS